MERFLSLYQNIYSDLYRLAYYYMGNAQDAEDSVQDAALSACQHFHKLKKEASFRSWMFTILINRCKKNLKKRGQRELTMEHPLTLCTAGSKELDSQTEILELLQTLTEEERLIVTLTVFGGYKSEEIAHMLHRNHNTIRSKYRKKIKKLKQELTSEANHTSNSRKRQRKEKPI